MLMPSATLHRVGPIPKYRYYLLTALLNTAAIPLMPPVPDRADLSGCCRREWLAPSVPASQTPNQSDGGLHERHQLVGGKVPAAGWCFLESRCHMHTKSFCAAQTPVWVIAMFFAFFLLFITVFHQARSRFRRWKGQSHHGYFSEKLLQQGLL